MIYEFTIFALRVGYQIDSWAFFELFFLFSVLFLFPFVCLLLFSCSIWVWCLSPVFCHLYRLRRFWLGPPSPFVLVSFYVFISRMM
ncbi:hypothetical protein MtrunA17_Chr7g0256781 [Medicago truncatula]|uniref:Transmembrane protein n=1 Tax=Medicago truncatula TaxID=3880 RepID=A0A396H386_MEDTR|nr:hypothetical protein MtrunA17_Chr7g0256781 [Medicago truncatula]